MSKGYYKIESITIDGVSISRGELPYSGDSVTATLKQQGSDTQPDIVEVVFSNVQRAHSVTAETATKTEVVADDDEDKDKVDKSKLGSAISSAEEIESSKYTDESVSALNSAIEAAKAVMGDEKSTQESVDSATKSLTEAMANLVEKPNKDELIALIATANEKATDERYTDESVEALKSVITTSQSVVDDESATSEAIKEATTALSGAIDGLVVKTYTLTIDIDGVTTTQSVEYGSDNTINWTLADGYGTKSVVVDDKSVTAKVDTTSYIFESINADHSIAVTTAEVVKVNISYEGVDRDDEVELAIKGEAFIISSSRVEHYGLIGMCVDGGEDLWKDGIATYSLGILEKDTDVVLKYKQKSYIISVPSAEGVVTDTATTTYVSAGDSFSMKFSAKDHYKITSLTLDGDEIYTDGMSEYTYTPSGGSNFKFTTDMDVFTLTIDESIKNNENITLIYDETIPYYGTNSIKITPESGKYVDVITIDGVECKIGGVVGNSVFKIGDDKVISEIKTAATTMVTLNFLNPEGNGGMSSNHTISSITYGTITTGELDTTALSNALNTAKGVINTNYYLERWTEATRVPFEETFASSSKAMLTATTQEEVDAAATAITTATEALVKQPYEITLIVYKPAQFNYNNLITDYELIAEYDDRAVYKYTYTLGMTNSIVCSPMKDTYSNLFDYSTTYFNSYEQGSDEYFNSWKIANSSSNMQYSGIITSNKVIEVKPTGYDAIIDDVAKLIEKDEFISTYTEESRVTLGTAYITAKMKRDSKSNNPYSTEYLNSLLALYDTYVALEKNGGKLIIKANDMFKPYDVDSDYKTSEDGEIYKELSYGNVKTNVAFTIQDGVNLADMYCIAAKLDGEYYKLDYAGAAYDKFIPAFGKSIAIFFGRKDDDLSKFYEEKDYCSLDVSVDMDVNETHTIEIMPITSDELDAIMAENIATYADYSELYTSESYEAFIANPCQSTFDGLTGTTATQYTITLNPTATTAITGSKYTNCPLVSGGVKVARQLDFSGWGNTKTIKAYGGGEVELVVGSNGIELGGYVFQGAELGYYMYPGDYSVTGLTDTSSGDAIEYTTTYELVEVVDGVKSSKDIDEYIGASYTNKNNYSYTLTHIKFTLDKDVKIAFKVTSITHKVPRYSITTANDINIGKSTASNPRSLGIQANMYECIIIEATYFLNNGGIFEAYGNPRDYMIVRDEFGEDITDSVVLFNSTNAYLIWCPLHTYTRARVANTNVRDYWKPHIISYEPKHSVEWIGLGEG